MDIFTASEAAYKNGFNDGYLAGGYMATRLKVAYEQLSTVYTDLGRNDQESQHTDVLHDIQEILDSILALQVKLGISKR